MPPHPSTNFEIQQYYQSRTKLNGICLRNKLPTIKDEAYVINLDEYELIGTHWIALHVKVTMGVHLTMQPTLTTLESNSFENKFKHS